MYKVSDAMDDVKEMVNGIDRRLGFHINIVSENLGKMTNLVEEVHEAIMDSDSGMYVSILNITCPVFESFTLSRFVRSC